MPAVQCQQCIHKSTFTMIPTKSCGVLHVKRLILFMIFAFFFSIETLGLQQQIEKKPSVLIYKIKELLMTFKSDELWWVVQVCCGGASCTSTLFFQHLKLFVSQETKCSNYSILLKTESTTQTCCSCAIILPASR